MSSSCSKRRGGRAGALVGLARHAGALVIATDAAPRTVMWLARKEPAAHHIVVTGDLGADRIVELVRSPHAPTRSITSSRLPSTRTSRWTSDCSSSAARLPLTPLGTRHRRSRFWPLVFKNIRVFFLGSDVTFQPQSRRPRRISVNEALENEGRGFEVEGRFLLESIADAHAAVEERKVSGRVILSLRRGTSGIVPLFLRRGTTLSNRRRRGDRVDRVQPNKTVTSEKGPDRRGCLTASCADGLVVELPGVALTLRKAYSADLERA